MFLADNGTPIEPPQKGFASPMEGFATVMALACETPGIYLVIETDEDHYGESTEFAFGELRKRLTEARFAETNNAYIGRNLPASQRMNASLGGHAPNRFSRLLIGQSGAHVAFSEPGVHMCGVPISGVAIVDRPDLSDPTKTKRFVEWVLTVVQTRLLPSATMIIVLDPGSTALKDFREHGFDTLKVAAQ